MTSQDRLFLLPESAHPLSFRRVGPDHFELHHNGCTSSFSRASVDALKLACFAMLSDQFDRATQETVIRAETNADRPSATPAVFPSRPTLDQL